MKFFIAFFLMLHVVVGVLLFNREEVPTPLENRESGTTSVAFSSYLEKSDPIQKAAHLHKDDNVIYRENRSPSSKP